MMKGYGLPRHLEIQWAFDFGGRMFGMKGSMTKRSRRGNYHKSRGASQERNAQRGRARMEQKEFVRALLADSP
jgi:hypothetical protein